MFPPALGSPWTLLSAPLPCRAHSGLGWTVSSPFKGTVTHGTGCPFSAPWNCSELVSTYCISCVPLPPRAQSPEDHPLCMPCRGPVPSDPMHKESYRSLLRPSQSHFCVSPYCTGRWGLGLSKKSNSWVKIKGNISSPLQRYTSYTPPYVTPLLKYPDLVKLGS